MADQPPPSEPSVPPQDGQHAGSKGDLVRRKATYLVGREYLPMLFTLAFWALAVLAVGHADAVRLLAASVLMRAAFMLTQINSASALRRRWHEGRAVRRQALIKTATVQMGALVATALGIGLLGWLLTEIGQTTIAEMLLLTAVGIPARLWRTVDLNSRIKMFRLYTTGSMVLAAGVVWLIDGGPMGYALAYGVREYFGTVAIRLFHHSVRPSKQPTTEPLEFAELARNTVVASRRMMTYRMTKNILTVLGPFGSFAARTGRGLKYHGRLERYLPHKRVGFVLFALVSAGIGAGLILLHGKPLSMVVGAGALQLSALATNILLWWRYLPVRDDPEIIVEDDDD